MGIELLTAPLNVNGRPNSDVVKPFLTVADLTDRLQDEWITDFYGLSEAQAAAYEAPFHALLEIVREARQGNREARTSTRWWLFRRSGKEFRTNSNALKQINMHPTRLQA
jgi:hypothetical protein